MNKKNKLSRLLRYLDIFGQPISFFINGDKKHKTPFGGIITILMIIIMMAVTLTSFIKLINKSSLYSTKDTTFTTDPPFLNLNQENFMFAVGVPDPIITLNNSLFTYKAFLSSKNQTDQEETMIPISLAPCQPQDFGDTSYEFNIDFNNYLCPQNFSYGIYGSYANAEVQFIDIGVNKCVNGTNPYVICASDTFINTYFQRYGSAIVILAFTNKVVNMQNQTHPFKTFLDGQYLKINPFSQLVYNINIYFRSNQILSYDDIFGIASPNVYDGITYEKERMDNIALSMTDSTQYIQFNLYSSNYQNYYTRTYDTFLNVLAYIGGILNLLVMLAGFIVSIFNDYKYEMKMINELYDFDLKEYTNNNENKMHELTESNDLSSKTQINEQIDTSIIKQKVENLKNLRSGLDFTVKDFIKSIFGSCKSASTKIKKKLFDLANDQLAKDLDILWLIKKIQDIDKLKSILLYPDKLKIFEFIPPPIISIDNNQKMLYGVAKYMRSNTIKKFERNESTPKPKNKVQDLDEYYNCSNSYINLKNKKDIISKNIVESLDPEIVEIFDWLEKAKKLQLLDRSDNIFNNIQDINDLPMTFIINPNEDKKQKMKPNEMNISASTIIEKKKKVDIITNKHFEKSELSINSLNFRIQQERSLN